MSITEMNVLLHGLLREVRQWNTSVIPDNVNIEESYSIYQSLRLEVTLEEKNVEMLEEVINANIRWRKKYQSKGKT